MNYTSARPFGMHQNFNLNEQKRRREVEGKPARGVTEEESKLDGRPSKKSENVAWSKKVKEKKVSLQVLVLN